MLPLRSVYRFRLRMRDFSLPSPLFSGKIYRRIIDTRRIRRPIGLNGLSGTVFCKHSKTVSLFI